MKKLNKIILGYSDEQTLNGTKISSIAMDKMVKNFFYCPIFEDYNCQKLVGVISGIELKEKKLIGYGYLIKKINLKNKIFRWGVSYSNKRKDFTKKIALCNVKLQCVGLIDKEQDGYNQRDKNEKKS